MAVYTGINGVKREVKKIYTGVNGVKREVKSGWTGVNGVKRKVFESSMPVVITCTNTGGGVRTRIENNIAHATYGKNCYADAAEIVITPAKSLIIKTVIVDITAVALIDRNNTIRLVLEGIGGFGTVKIQNGTRQLTFDAKLNTVRYLSLHFTGGNINTDSEITAQIADGGITIVDNNDEKWALHYGVDATWDSAPNAYLAKI